MRRIKLLILKFGIMALRIIYFLLKLLPTRKKMLFISRQSNEPTLDYVILHKALKEKYPDYQIVMLTKKIDNKMMYMFHMFWQMIHIATSKILFLDSYCIVACILKHKNSLKIVQLWHSVGCMKKFGYAMLDKPEGYPSEIAKIMCLHKNYDCILISSFSFIKDFEEGFQVNKEIVKEIPLPRIDFLLNDDYNKNRKKELLKEHPEIKKKKNILYCPTFRKENKNGSLHIENLIENIDLKKYNLIYMPHPLNTIKTSDLRIITNFKTTYDALLIADAVICDYTSMMYEFGLLNLPIYFYAYDWEDYQGKRELNLDLTKLPVLFTANPRKIISAIEKDDFDYEGFKKVVDKNIKIPEVGCVAAILDLIDKYL